MTGPGGPTGRDLARRRAHRRVLALMLALVAGLATLFSLVGPPFEPPDELQHYQYVRHLLDTGRLPVQPLDGPITQSHQPPLYYLGGALLVAGLPDPQVAPPRNPFWGFRAGQVSQDNKRQFLPAPGCPPESTGTPLVVHVLRLWSVLLSLTTVVAVWLTARALWPRRPGRVAAVLAVAVLNPMFLYMAGAVNNDSLIIAAGAWLIWLSLVAWGDGFRWRTTLLLGVAWGVALLAKLSGLVLVATWGWFLLAAGRRQRRWQLVVSRAAVIGGMALALAGPWFAYNWRVYGEPFALNTMLSVWGSRSAAQVRPSLFAADLAYAWTNFWGRFGYGQVPLPPMVYWLLLAATAVALAGGVRWLAVGGLRRLPYERRVVWLGLVVTGLGYLAAFAYYLYRSDTGANGRYLFPALPALAALLVAGAAALWSPRRRGRLAEGAVTGLMLALALFALLFLRWTYAPPPVYAGPAPVTPAHAAAITFPGLAELVGVDVPAAGATPGATLPVTLVWRVTGEPDRNYPLFVQLVDGDGQRLAGRDTHAGLGRYPTSCWRPGHTIVDTIPVPIPPTTAGPTGLWLIAGLNDGAGHPLAAAGGDTTHVLARLRLAPPAPAESGAAPGAATAGYRLGEMVTLIAVAPPPAAAASGASVSFTLTWRAAAAPLEAYTVFVHLLDAQGALVEAYDSPPQAGAYPTDLWQAGDVVVDRRRITLPPDLPPGAYQVTAGWYRPVDLGRLPVTDGQGQPVAENSIPLFSLEVR